MTLLYGILSGVLLAFCVVLVTMILMQKKRSTGMGNVMSGMGSQQTFWDKNKGRSLEGTLEKYTKIAGGLFMLLSLALNFVK